MNPVPHAVFDSDLNCFVISPLIRKNGVVNTDIRLAIRTVQQTTNMSWGQLGKYIGVTDRRMLFGIAMFTKYVPKSLLDKLQKSLVVNTTSDQAFLYSLDNQPAEDFVPTHIGPIVTNSVPTAYVVAEATSTPIFSAVCVSDPLNRVLSMSMTPSGGTLVLHKPIFGMTQGSMLCADGQKYVYNSKPEFLNTLLSSIGFVANHNESAQIVIAVDDNQGKALSVSSCTVKATVALADVLEPATLTLPSDVSVSVGEATIVGAVVIEDEYNREHTIRITPFGGELTGISGLSASVSDRAACRMSGTAEILNARMEALVFTASADQCAIGVELTNGDGTITQYAVFTVSDSGDTGVTDPEEEVVDPEEETVAPEVEEDDSAPVLTTMAPELELATGGTTTVSIEFTGTRTTAFDVVVSVSEVIAALSSDTSVVIDSESPYSFNGTIAEVNAQLADITITGGSEDGYIKIVYFGISGQTNFVHPVSDYVSSDL